MEESVRKKQRKVSLETHAVLFIALCASFLNPGFFNTIDDIHVGYTDYTQYIRGLDDTLSGKVIYKDFYWWYGPLFLYIQVIPYIILGQNHYALFVSLYRFLPFISIILSSLWAKVFIRSNPLRFLFIFVCISQYVSGTYPSLRHLAAELAIALYVLSLRWPEKKSLTLQAGMMCAAGILTSLEYGLTGLFTILTAHGMSLLVLEKAAWKKRTVRFLWGFSTLIVPYLAYLAWNGVLFKYFAFNYALLTHFESPARGELFPALPEIHFDSLVSFFISAYHFFISQNLRYYLPLYAYFFTLGYFAVQFIRLRKKRLIELYCVALFGLIIFGRTLGGPAYGYLAYGLLPAITLGFIFLDHVQDRLRNSYREQWFHRAAGYTILISAVAWIFLTVENKELFNLKGKFNLFYGQVASGKVYRSLVGFPISQESYRQFTAINEYIETHTAPSDPLYVYPWGPYNHFTGRPSPVTARDTYDFIAGEPFIQEAVRQLEEAKPALVILNTYNSPVTIGSKRGDVGEYVGWGTENSPCFAGRGNALEFYLLENYQLEKRFDYAVILGRRAKKKAFRRNFLPVYTLRPEGDPVEYFAAGGRPKDNQFTLELRERKGSLEFVFPEPYPATHLEIQYRVKNSVWKRLLSKSFVKVSFRTRHDKFDPTKDYVWFTNIEDLNNFNSQRTAWMGFGGTLHPIYAVKVEIETPEPYAIVDALEIREVKLLRLQDWINQPTK